MKKISVIVLTVLLLMFVPSVAAQSLMQGKSVFLPKDKTVNENYFAAGDTVTVSGTVNGDAYVAGGTVYVDGTINGDLLVAGGTLNITGVVTGDIRGAGGQVNIGGKVDGNVTIVGGNINISENANISKGLVAAGGQLNIMAPLGKGMVAGAGQLTLNNTINGNVLAGVGNLVMSPRAKINGNLTYYSEDKATFSTGAVVKGSVDYHQQKTYKPERNNKQVEKAATKMIGTGLIMMAIYSFITTFIAGALIIRFVPRITQQTIDIIDRHPWTSMGIGFLTLVVTPIIAFLLVITILGIPFAVFLMTLYFIVLCVSHIFVALYAGRKISGWLNWKTNSYLTFFMGLLAVSIGMSIPVLGWLLKFIITIVGIGSLLIAKKEVYTQLRAKNLI